MARVYRAMTVDEDGKPKIGASARTLGVRVGDGEYDDISVDKDGNVHPGTGGMSVTPAWRNLSSHRIPRRLCHIISDAVGSNRDACWRFGDGEFRDSLLTENLSLSCDTDIHGEVQPKLTVEVVAFQNALAETREHWEIDEE